MFNAWTLVSFKLQLAHKVAPSCTLNQSGGLYHIWMQSPWDKDRTAGQHYCGMGRNYYLYCQVLMRKLGDISPELTSSFFLHKGCLVRAWAGWGGFDVHQRGLPSPVSPLISMTKEQESEMMLCVHGACMYERVVYELIVDATCIGTD